MVLMTALGMAGAAKGQTYESKPIAKPLQEAPAEKVVDPSLDNIDSPLPARSIFDITLEYKKDMWQQEHPGEPLTEEVIQRLTAEVIRELQPQEGEEGSESTAEEGPAS